MILACHSGNLKLVEYIISLNKVDLTKKDILNKIYILFYIINLIILQNYYIFIEFNKSIFFNNTVLHYMCRYGYFDIVKYVISLDVIDINSIGILIIISHFISNLKYFIWFRLIFKWCFKIKNNF